MIGAPSEGFAVCRERLTPVPLGQHRCLLTLGTGYDRPPTVGEETCHLTLEDSGGARNPPPYMVTSTAIRGGTFGRTHLVQFSRGAVQLG